MRLIDADELMQQVKYIHEAVDAKEANIAYDTGFHSATSQIQGLIAFMPTVKVVSMELYRQIVWERDIAFEQLEEHGITFGCIAPDVVKVVRCKDCQKSYEIPLNFRWCDKWKNIFREHDYCSFGERGERKDTT